MDILPSVRRFLCFCIAWLLAISSPALFGAAPQVTLDSASVFEVPALPLNPYFPDGHTSVVQDGSGSLVFAAGESSYRIELDANGAIKNNPSLPLTTPVLSMGRVGDTSYSYDNGGAWLYSVHRVGNTQKLLGFYHAEDHWPGIQTSIANYTWIAWKSIALAISEDNGKTWQKRGQIITSPTARPSSPEWGGAGDHCVVWDTANGRWLCFYGSENTNGLCMAQSTDPEGTPGTWFKFYNGFFNEPGIGGKESPAPGLGHISGANPSVHFNTKLNRWVMVFHSNDDAELEHPNSLYIASSSNLVQWDTPVLLIAPSAGYQRFWNPTIVGASDVGAGENATLYYGAWVDKSSPKREMIVRDIVFDSMSPKVAPTLDASLFLVPGTVGATTSFLVTGSESPTSFHANLPQGLVISSGGRITGVPARAGLELGSVTASNEVGESQSAALLFVTDADVSTTTSQAAVTYAMPSAEALGLKSISGLPVSGSAFQVGTSNVTVSAVYQSGRTVSLTFKVTVRKSETEVVDAAEIVTQPGNVSVNAGSVFTLNVAAKGTGTLLYQWRKDGVEIRGATLPELLFNRVSAADAGSYDVLVRSANGVSTQSATARVKLNVPAAILTQPSSLSLTSGQSGTLSVAVSGDGPFVYQWRKDGKIISGATSASYVISNATESRAGRYEVLVSNVAGSVLSNAAMVSVSVPAQIIRPPADVALVAGSVVTLSVLARGSGSLSYQWYRNGVPLAAANSPQLFLGALSEASKGTYRVSVLSNYGDFASASAVVDVLPSNPGGTLAILVQPTDVVMLKGSAVSLPVTVDPSSSDSVRTRYRLNALSAGKLTPLALAGNISSSGQFNLPLGSLGAACGDYVLVVSRDFGNGAVVEARSQPFRVETHGWEDAAGTYEALLKDRTVAPNDGAQYRGLISLTVTNKGSVSGRISYNQALPLNAGGKDAPRLYFPVTHAFSGALVPEPGAPLRVRMTHKFGRGAQYALQEMTVTLDFTDSPAELSVIVRDHASAFEGGDCISAAERVSRLPAGLPILSSGLLGRYTIVANGLPSGVDDNGQLLVQVRASGRVIWTSRFPGFAGSGSANLNTNDPSNPTFELYEARALTSPSLFKSESWLAQVGFKTLADNTLQAHIPVGKLERHSSYVGKLPSPVGAPATYRFDPQTHRSAVSVVDFSNGDGACWAKVGSAILPAFFRTNVPIQMTVTDVQQNGALGIYSWSLNISSAGLVRATGIASSQGLPPALNLRLDKNSGELLGFYAVQGVRRGVFGAALRADEGVTAVGRGWIETPEAAKTAPRTWSLDPLP